MDQKKVVKLSDARKKKEHRAKPKLQQLQI